MADLYLTEAGDLAIGSNGDLAITENIWRDLSQQAYLRIMTQIGDFTLYPSLGADLEALIGMPQSKETADYGISLIKSALDREGKFIGTDINIKAVPTSFQSIRFDLYITSGSKTQMILSIEQDLGIDTQYTGLQPQIGSTQPSQLLGE
jgi:hypothetical protein